MLSNSSILVTGGTGSFGKAFIASLLNKKDKPRRIVVFSRDELKQWNMRQKFPEDQYPELRFFIGDIRDRDRLRRACEDIDYIIHSAAMKQVPASEYNPMECIKTNIIGAENVIEAALDNKVKKIIALSTDKAAAPINIYGASKLCSDKLFIAANNIVGSRDLSISIVRYGNVMGSRGSVIPLFMRLAKTGVLPITHTEMTRFNITIKEGVGLVLWSLNNTFGGEIVVPKISSYRILDVAKAIGPNCKQNIIGLRPGEKLHEKLITVSDSLTTYDIGNYYLILPQSQSSDLYISHYNSLNLNLLKVEENFTYDSGKNSIFLSDLEIRNLIKLNIKDDFEPI